MTDCRLITLSVPRSPWRQTRGYGGLTAQLHHHHDPSPLALELHRPGVVAGIAARSRSHPRGTRSVSWRGRLDGGEHGDTITARPGRGSTSSERALRASESDSVLRSSTTIRIGINEVGAHT